MNDVLSGFGGGAAVLAGTGFGYAAVDQHARMKRDAAAKQPLDERAASILRAHPEAGSLGELAKANPRLEKLHSRIGDLGADVLLHKGLRNMIGVTAATHLLLGIGMLGSAFGDG